MLKKNFYSLCLTLIFTMCCLVCIPNKITGHAEDSKPTLTHDVQTTKTIVDTQTWDYNGISCNAIIYNDGCVDVQVTDVSYTSQYNPKTPYSDHPMNFPVPYGERLYSLSTEGDYWEGCIHIVGKLKIYNTLSYYPKCYVLTTDKNIDYRCDYYNTSYGPCGTAHEVKYLDFNGRDVYLGVTTTMYESVPLLTFASVGTKSGLLSFVPNVNTPTGTYEFNLFSKTFFVTYNNAEQSEYVDNILRLDTNNDGKIDSMDATNILEIYAINSTGGNIKTFKDLENYKNEQKEKNNKSTIIDPPFPEEDSGDLNNGLII